MLSSEGKITDNEETKPQVTNATPLTQEREANTSGEVMRNNKQMFSLIDTLLSLEACLYHQILPLELKDNQLLLGMVNPQDIEALDYVTRIVCSINYTTLTEIIPSEYHQAILSAYLNYKNTYSPDATPMHQSIVDFAPNPNLDSTSGNHHQREDDKTTEGIMPSKLTVLPVQIPETLSPIEVLATLPPKKLLAELLARVLVGGIGRLYLERQHDQGRILWSDNGVLQSVIENLPIAVFQDIINEFKQFADLPAAKLPQPQQVEKEWLYQNNSLLLRLRVMPGIYGEEATLQVLRGAALKFYQQQQLHRLSRDTLVMTQQLSFKLHELEQRLLLNANLQSEQLTAVLALSQLVENLDKQLNVLAGDNQPPASKKS